MNDLNNNVLRNLFIGLDTKVKIFNDIEVIPINFDNAATTPVFINVFDKIKEACETYGAIGRGVGQKSIYSTKIYYDCKDYILDFFNAPKDKYTTIFVNNTTEGINRLSNILIKSKTDIVITTRMEHHSNDLPWRNKCTLKYVEVDELGRLKLDELKYLLEKYNGLVKYVSLTAASNVTGYINDLSYISEIVHKYNAKLIVDGAQIIAHKSIDFSVLNIDYLVFSAHKMYAPFGSGAIIGPIKDFEEYDSDFKGGGTVDSVFDDSETLLYPPEKNEAGSPNFFGALALVEAMKELKKISFTNIENNERILLNYAIKGLSSIKDITLYGDIKNTSDRLGIIVFNIKDMPHDNCAKILADLSGISVRQGAFCAHPYVRRLLKINDYDAIKNYHNPNYKAPGMVRASFGIYNSKDEVDTLLNTIELICRLKK